MLVMKGLSSEFTFLPNHILRYYGSFYQTNIRPGSQFFAVSASQEDVQEKVKEVTAQSALRLL